MTSVFPWLAAFWAITGALGYLVTAIAILRSRDAVSRVNALGPATALGFPGVVLAALFYRISTDGWSWVTAIESAGAILAALVVSSTASNALGSAAYRSGAPLDPATDPNDLLGDAGPHVE